MQWDSSLPDYFTHAISCDHFQQLVIDGFAGSAGPNTAVDESVIDLSEGKDAEIKNLQKGNVSGDNYQSGKRKPLKWLSQENVSGLDFIQP